jgi:hypothetical protein
MMSVLNGGLLILRSMSLFFLSSENWRVQFGLHIVKLGVVIGRYAKINRTTTFSVDHQD